MAKLKKSKKAPAPANGDSEAKSGKSKGGLIGTIVTPLILAAASFATVYSLPTPHSAPVVHDEAEDEYDAEPLHFTSADTGIVELNEFTLSLREDKQVLRILLALETPESMVGSIDPNDLRLRDAFMSYLRAIEVEQLQDVAFLPQLRAQLLRRAKLVLGDSNVSGILITEFLIR
ncbi:flagellar basal body-associated protein FliL [Litorimonas taeanensis]|uniref:Flagellar protein FliL n=1 Tax=Litorimonas taeanensis TaxID=568099 RepID=A0A420WMA1_9PROT|nr:flagellar basal body-associated FliL family protein [Litorimonas taeanensis]RKQ72171.1 flagellar basal body-associated protein FliL [Litorimonas taeanensis]